MYQLRASVAPASAMGRLGLASAVYDSFVAVCPTVVGVTLADTDRARDVLPGCLAFRRATFRQS